MHSQVITEDHSVTGSFGLDSEVVVLHGTASKLRRAELEQEQRRRNAAFKLPIETEAGLIGRLLSGAEPAPSFKVAVMAEAYGVSYGAVTARLLALMVPALYLADCKVAELRHARNPIHIEVLATHAVQRYGIAHLADMKQRSSEAYRRDDEAERKRIYPMPRREQEAVDAAWRWMWTRFPERS